MPLYLGTKKIDTTVTLLNQEASFNEGFNQGKNEGLLEGNELGYAQGIEQGKQDSYDAFWDIYQQNGTRTSYEGAFGGSGWNKDTFKPKYPIVLSGTAVADNMFFAFNKVSSGSNELDLIDFSKFNINLTGCKRFASTFRNARIKNLTLDCSNATTLSDTFRADNGGYIENLTLKVTDKTTSFSSAFSSQVYIKNITFTDDSEISASISFKDCKKLTNSSIRSILRALSQSKSGLAVGFSLAAVNKAFETSKDANDGSTSSEWIDLVGEKNNDDKPGIRPNWTITLS